jgi:parallel beta-helix repeat protein
MVSIMLIMMISAGNDKSYCQGLKPTRFIDDGRWIAPADTYTPHGPIVIHGNSGFSSLGFTGQGDSGDPYLIEKLSITASNEECIVIRDTTAYFEVRDCLISHEWTRSHYVGIFFDNVAHGIVRNCIINERSYGISTENSSSCILTNNTISDNLVGAFLKESIDCILINNSASTNYYNGFLLTNSSTCILNNNSAFNNREEGFGLSHSYNCTLIDNTASGSYTGFHLDDSANCTVTQCTAYSNSNSGFAVPYSYNCTLTNNTAYGNSFDGFTLHESTNCTLTYNIAFDNLEYGIRLYPGSEYNTIYLNRLGSNGESTARDDGKSNAWDDGVSSGNYWKDYKGGDWYFVLGLAQSIDHYPLLWEPLSTSAGSTGDVPDIMLIMIITGAGIITLSIVITIIWRRRNR